MHWGQLRGLLLKYLGIWTINIVWISSIFDCQYEKLCHLYKLVHFFLTFVIPLPPIAEARLSWCQIFLGFHAQKQLPEFVAVNSECLWNLRSIILPNEQFVSYYGIRHIIAWENYFTKKCIHVYPLQVYKYEIWELDFYSRWLCIMHPQLLRTGITFDWLLPC